MAATSIASPQKQFGLGIIGHLFAAPSVGEDLAARAIARVGMVAENAKRQRIGEHPAALERPMRRPMPGRADRRAARLTVFRERAKPRSGVRGLSRATGLPVEANGPCGIAADCGFSKA
jgi:hypothetical protein